MTVAQRLLILLTKTINGVEGRAMRLSCAEQILGERPLAEKLTLARDAAFDGLDLRWGTLAAPSTMSVLGEHARAARPAR